MTAARTTSRVPLRVVVWNIAQKGDAAWQKLDALGADIALLNEAVVPAGRSGLWSAEGTRGRDSGRRPWSAAVVTQLPWRRIEDAEPRFRQSVRHVPFQCSRPGTWLAAQVETPLGNLTSVALYGLMDELSDASVHRSLSELSPLMEDPRYQKLVVLGGDLNTGTQWPVADRRWNDRDRNVLDRIAALGLVDCVQAKRPAGRLPGCQCVDGDDCRHVRTRRHPGHQDIPYQTDYLFASKALASKLTACEVLATDEWFELSDHAPIVADFRV